jgi:DNA-binding Lrp family transcriptional regulator
MGVLGALLKKKSVQPNIRQVQRHTGYHMATIKGSLAFLEGQGVLQGFGPKIDSKKLSYSLEVLTLLQVDLSHQKAFEKFLEALQSDPHTYWASSIIGSGNWNILCRHIYRDVESYHRDLQKRYMRIPGYHDLIKNMQSFFSVEPVFKNKSRTECIIELVKEGNPKRD